MPLLGPPDVARLLAKKDVRGLIKALGYEKAAAVRCGAAQALGGVGDPGAVGALAAALHDGDATVRTAVATALGRIGAAGAAAPLAASLLDPDRATRKAAAEALDAVAWRPDRDAVGATYWAARQAWDECAEIGAPAVGALCDALADEDGGDRAAAARALGTIGERAAAEPLAAALEDKNPAVRLAAAQALGAIGDARAVEPLILAHGDTDRAVRRAAAAALAQIGPAAVDPLAAALKGLRMPDRRADAARALGAIGDVRVAVETLTAALRDGAANVRQAAAEALGAIGDACAVEPLVAVFATYGDQPNVCGAAAEALGEIGPPAVDALIALVEDREAKGRRFAARALGTIGDVRAVEILVVALRDEDQGVRVDAAIALGRMGDARAVEPLIAALEDEASIVRLEATLALGTIGDARAVGPLATALGKEGASANSIGDALAAMGAPAVESLIAALRDERHDRRAASASALGKIGDPRAVEPLIDALEDGADDVSIAAAGALGEIGDARAVEPLVAGCAAHEAVRRRAAALAAARLGDDRAAAALLEALDHASWYVRKTAAEALVLLYQDGALGSAQKALVLRRRGDIMGDHHDHQDGRTDDCNNHFDSHTDSGVGIGFPLAAADDELLVDSEVRLAVGETSTAETPATAETPTEETSAIATTDGPMRGNPEAAWYADPMGRHQHRYWDGAQWTHHVADDGVAAVDELQAAPAAEPAADERRVEVPNTWGLGDGSPFSLPLHPDMARVFAATDKSEHYKIMFMYLVHPDPAVRLATLQEAERIGWYPGSHQALVDSLADESPGVREVAARLVWRSEQQTEFTLDCLADEINRTGWTSTMSAEQAMAALDALRAAAPPDKLAEFEESVARITGAEQ